MSERSCAVIAELLVDFSDGGLSAADRQSVESHLSGCPACRREVERLGHSLELAQSIWAQAAAEASGATAESRHRPLPRSHKYSRPAAVLAASAAVVLIGLAVWWLIGVNREVAVRESPAPAERRGSEPAEPKARTPSEDVDVEQIFARKTRAARLAASARLLATEPSLKVYQTEAEHYLAQTYPEDAPTHSPSNPSAVSPSKEPKS